MQSRKIDLTSLGPSTEAPANERPPTWVSSPFASRHPNANAALSEHQTASARLSCRDDFFLARQTFGVVGSRYSLEGGNCLKFVPAARDASNRKPTAQRKTRTPLGLCSTNNQPFDCARARNNPLDKECSTDPQAQPRTAFGPPLAPFPKLLATHRASQQATHTANKTQTTS